MVRYQSGIFALCEGFLLRAHSSSRKNSASKTDFTLLSTLSRASITFIQAKLSSKLL